MLRRRLLLATVLAVGCGSSEERPTVVGGDRPVEVGVPKGFDPDRSYPLILVLHGYGANGFVQRAYLGAGAIQDRGEAFVVAPDGLEDHQGRQFWNADDVCCDFDDKNPDDVAYLSDIVEAVVEAYPIDRGAIFALGHSNGGYMSYRMACERPDLVAALVSLAGSTVSVPCTPAQTVSVLQVHGDADAVVPFALAQSTVVEWAERNGCDGGAQATERLDLDNAVPGADTATSTTGGCPADGAVDLWRIEGGSHIPAFSAAWEPAMWTWLQAHRRP